MSKHILVVDDEPDLIQVIRTILQTKGHEVEEAHDGQEALQRIALRKPDLLVIDLMMPVISGLEVVRRLRRDEATADLPIIVISAAGKESGKPEEFFREGIGADDFIAKPFDPLNLLGRVEAVLRIRGYQTEESQPPRREEKAAPRSTARKGGVLLEELPTFGPAEIVKAFVESWNTQDFAVEYRCLAPTLTGNLPEKSYVLRRQQTFADDQDRDRASRVKGVAEMEADEDTARVVVDREDTERGRTTKRREEYALIRGEDNWQIKMVRPLDS